ncbi:hypothetical protein FA95DRAFT_986434 [Auriscalpium vulgare]|uniref:Uncharacterized protein n=1 Tax=Auriscalpium vulgare TaxID=40419 RepID=A0ACB8RXT9_9AGAM|nr:hypothetical protein FA95DRAFT_986434 [Auriscalpium vulgare]
MPSPQTATKDADQSKVQKEVQNDVESVDLWLSDGNIIIRSVPVGASRTRTLYKVHKSTLARHCDAFASLFDGPHAALDAGSEHRDGIPVMDLPDDADDLRHFLKALYDWREMQIHRPMSAIAPDGRWNIVPPSYFGILRLAVKYGADDLQDLVKTVLRAQWPSTLQGWDELQSCPVDETHTCIGDTAYLPPNPARAIRLAIDCDLPEIIPTAYYALSCLLRTFTSEGRVPNMRSLLAGLATEEVASVFRSQMLFQLIVQNVLLKGPIGPWVEQCNRPAENRAICTVALRKWSRNTLVQGQHIDDPIGWLRWLGAACNLNALDLRKDACVSCRRQTRVSILKERQELWKDLPSIFGLNQSVVSQWERVSLPKLKPALKSG